MSDGYLGEIRMFGGNFAPVNWALCNGQLLPLDQFQALYAVIGTTYGGDGQTTVGLPELRARAPVGAGQGIGQPNVVAGQPGGAETVTLTTAQLPAHNHTLQASTVIGSVDTPAASTVLSAGGPSGATRTPYANANAGTSRSVSSPTTTTAAGGSVPHENMQPYLAVNFIICVEGVFPQQP